jgi:hypothetical protein
MDVSVKLSWLLDLENESWPLGSVTDSRPPCPTSDIQLANPEGSVRSRREEETHQP